MFAKAERLDRAEFSETYKHGRKIHLPGITLVYLQAPTRKVAAVVGKKVAKSAVTRNLIRRRLYAALFESKVQRGHIVLIAKPATSTYSYSHLETEVASALNRVKRVDV